MRAFLGPLSLGEGKSVDLGPSAGVTGHVTAQQRGPAAPSSPPCRFGSPPFGIGALGIPCSAFPAFLAAAEFREEALPLLLLPPEAAGSWQGAEGAPAPPASPFLQPIPPFTC